jgi:hypothetical protein
MAKMETGMVERAFQLATEFATVEEIRARLRAEGYSNVDAHLQGSTIRLELKKLLALRRSDSG